MHSLFVPIVPAFPTHRALLVWAGYLSSFVNTSWFVLGLWTEARRWVVVNVFNKLGGLPNKMPADSRMDEELRTLYRTTVCVMKLTKERIKLNSLWRDRGSRVRFPKGAGNSSLHHRVQNGSEAHLASHPMGTRGSFPGGKVAGTWSWPLTSV